MLALDALLTERSVTRAAGVCGLTQSAMSHALGALRQLLRDQLLVRAGNDMRLTPRAAAMAPGVRRGLAEIRAALSGPPTFDPLRADRVFRLAATDAAVVTLFPEIVSECRKLAPHVRFDVLALSDRDMVAAIEHGELDLLISAVIPSAPALKQSKLFTEELVCVLRCGHPALKQPLDLPAFLSLEHIVIGTAGSRPSLIDQHLERLGHTRRVAMRIGYFLAAAFVVVESDLIATLPSRLARRVTRLLPVELRPLPLPNKAGVIFMAWHERYHDEEGSRWLRSLVAKVGQRIGSEATSGAGGD
jgi:DNA-binding transcriptional LysR family regulator